MKFIETGVELKLTHILKYQATLYSHEMDDIIGDMIHYIESKKGKATRILTITKGLNFETGKQRLVVDFYIEMNQPTIGSNKFSYLPIYELTNCVVSKYKGHPQNASIATKEVNDYIKKHELEPMSPVHQLMKIDMKTKKKEQKKNEVDLEVYIKVT